MPSIHYDVLRAYAGFKYNVEHCTLLLLHCAYPHVTLFVMLIDHKQ